MKNAKKVLSIFFVIGLLGIQEIRSAQDTLSAQLQNNTQCPICLESDRQLTVLHERTRNGHLMRHSYCKTCLKQVLSNHPAVSVENFFCPLCNIVIPIRELTPESDQWCRYQHACNLQEKKCANMKLVTPFFCGIAWGCLAIGALSNAFCPISYCTSCCLYSFYPSILLGTLALGELHGHEQALELLQKLDKEE